MSISATTKKELKILETTPPSNMDLQIVESNEAFTEIDDDFEFSHTKIILRRGADYFYAITKQRFHDNSDIDPSTLDIVPISSSQIWPPFPENLSRAPETSSPNVFVKQPCLMTFGDTVASTEIGRLILHEAEICEILKNAPHPNVAEYLGCVVEDNLITGLCFTRYDGNLSERIANGQDFDKNGCLKDIRLGIEHLHSLGIIHCDINPRNVFFAGDRFVIGDFDSCAFEGDKLGLKAGTEGWTNKEFEFARRENDLYGLSRIEELLWKTEKPGESP